MKAVVFDRIGSPEEVLTIRDVPIPEIKDDEVLVRMVSASINPGDLLFIQDLYPEPKKPVFPSQTGGNHGAGIIEKAGKHVTLKKGTLVAFSYYNTWAEFAVVPAEWLIQLPDGYPPQKAGQLVNPITAWDLLDQSGVGFGQWLALTAGNSTVSTMVSQFARHKGINIISIVRQRQKSIDLGAMGASAIIELSDQAAGGPSIPEQISEITQGSGIHGLIDNVGGPVTGELIRSMAFGGQVVINGGMSPDTFRLHNFDILMCGLVIRSHVYRYFFNHPKIEDMEMLRQVIAISRQSDFQVSIGGEHGLDDFRAAISGTIHSPEKGKHIFLFQDR